MNLISAANISKAYTEKWLFKQISFGLAKGEKLALVGSNGTGKSTLLKVISGLIEPDSGEVGKSKGLVFGYLPQEPELDPNKTIEESIFNADNPILQLVNTYEKAIVDPDYSADGMQTLLEQMEIYNAWDFEKRAAQILGKLGIHNLKLSNKSLSGGQKKRVALAQLLIQEPDVLILDEPTNHLDLEAIEWLENLLTAHQISLIMVTHDRYFLDNVATQILELERGDLYIHNGNYAYFLEKKSQRETINASELAKAKLLMSKELEWMRRMPKARGTKSKSRIEAFHDLKDKVSLETKNKELEISVQTSRLGNKIIEASHVSKKYGDVTLIKDFSYLFKKNDRIGIVGKNGIGKSTLLDVLTGKIEPSTGEIVHGPTLKIGYYTQHTNNLNNENRIIDEVKEIAEYVTLGNGEQVSVSKLLDMFLFPPSVQHTPVSKLSGGERRRLQLLKVLVANPNFLILDEPTNDLDIDTLNVLEDFLSNFAGCLLLVSHDRYFMDKLLDHLFVFEEHGNILDYYGNYSDYKEEINRKPVKEEQVENKISSQKIEKEAVAEKRKLSYKEQREYESLEREIEELERKKTDLTEKLSSGSTNHEELSKWSEEILEIDSHLEEKTERWLYLAEFI
ncbi:MAG: ABC-F family ATP-binding cassette domain-containing protein [Bacteroidia bacterium]